MIQCGRQALGSDDACHWWSLYAHAVLWTTSLSRKTTGPQVTSVDDSWQQTHIEVAGDPRSSDAESRTIRYTADALRGQIKILYETGYFEDVQVETDPTPDGVAVTFVVREKPFITEIVFDGNENLSDDKLKEKITIKSQAFLDQQQAKESAEKIRLAYQEDGYYNAQVIPVVQTVDEDRKRLTFFIKEGRKAKSQDRQFRRHAGRDEGGNVQGDCDPRMDSVVRTRDAIQVAVACSPTPAF